MTLHRNPKVIATAAAVALVCSACAAAPDRPDRALARAEAAVDLAQKTGAREYGPAALQRARSGLTQAEAAAANEEYTLALHLAERAELDAELAMAQTSHGKSERALHELRQSIEALQREIARIQSS